MVNRLKQSFRDRAYESICGKWGKSLIPTPCVLTEDEDKEECVELRYAYCIRHIAAEAPLRILPEELIVGASTLKEATDHQVPVRRPMGAIVTSSASHCTLGFYYVLETGYKQIRADIAESRKQPDLDDRQIRFLDACEICIEAAGVWHKRYMELLDELITSGNEEERKHYQAIRDNLEFVPENPPKTFREAIQSVWFMFDFQRLCGNWPGIGRLDYMLDKYLKKDLADGIITLDEARELIADFWIKGVEWAGSSEVFGPSGDAQHYQNIILSGVDEDGNEFVSDVTYLILDVVEELHISDFPIAVRISKRTPEKLLRRIADVEKLGGGTVAVYNNDFIINNLVNFGYPLEEARNFANDGCWEIQIPGKTCFTYYPFNGNVCIEKAMGVRSEEIPDYKSIEELYAAYDVEIKKITNDINDCADGWCMGSGTNVLFSLLTQDCIKRARSYYNRGAKYSVFAPHLRGVANIANSFYCIQKIVFEEKRMTYKEYIQCLKDDWEGHEELRREILSRFEFYGNDNEEVDKIAKRLLHDFSWFSTEIHDRNGVLRPAGVSTFGREISERYDQGATADGHKKGDILAPNISPSPGTDKYGPTAIIKSCCSLDLSCLVNGTALDLKFAPSAVKGEDGVNALVALYKTFVDEGGIFMHIDVVDNSTLKDAMEHPEKYPTLAVRVSGWSARFVTLDKEWQKMILIRSTQTHA